jgi:hypothetical protein
MNSPLEKTVVAAIMRALKARGVRWLIKTHGDPYQAAGLPDIIAIAPGTGRFLGIEVKRPGGRLTDLQKATLARINAAGGVAGVAFGVEDALALLEQASRGRDTNAD